MNKRFKNISVAIILSCLALLIVSPASAANLSDIKTVLGNMAKEATFVSAAEDAPASIEGIIGTALIAILTAFGIVYFILIFYGGVLWQTAHGDHERVEKARTIIQNSTIGLAIILGAYAIVLFVLGAIVTESGVLNTG